jgi:hypothetical protein
MEVIFLLKSEVRDNIETSDYSSISEYYTNYSEARRRAISIINKRNISIEKKIKNDFMRPCLQKIIFNEIAPDIWTNAFETITITGQSVNGKKNHQVAQKSQKRSLCPILKCKDNVENF